MPLDMDDLVSRRLVAHVAATRDPNGYLFAQGTSWMRVAVC